MVVLALAVPVVVAVALILHRGIHGRAIGFTPLAGYAGSWATVIGLYLVDPLELDFLAVHAWILIGVSFCAFVLGYWLAVGRRARTAMLLDPDAVLVTADPARSPLTWLWLICAVLGSVLFAIYVYELARIYGIGAGTLLALRLDLGIRSVPAGFYYFIFAELLVPISVVLAMTTARARRNLYLVAAGVATLSLLATSGRANATFALLWGFCAFALYRGRRLVSVRAVITGLAALVAAFAIFQVLGDTIGKTYLNSYVFARFGDQPPIPAPLVEPYLYLEGPLPTFSAVVRDTDSPGFGVYSLRPIIQVISFFDPDITPPPHVQDFKLIPYPFNLSTYLSWFYRDFGDAGVAFGAAAFGLIVGRLYVVWLRRRSPASLCLAAFACLAAIASVSDLVILDLSRVVELSAVTFVYLLERQMKLAGQRMWRPREQDALA